MDNTGKLKIVFEGRFMDAELISTYLADNGIECSVFGGEYDMYSMIYEDTSSGNTRIIVSENDFEKASLLVRQFQGS